ncbi:MAG: hypothetical protein IKK62_05830 [Bacteroidaceae bacterium]|nr:hypothetical protein [Bacteroidaceae bacterium]
MRKELYKALCDRLKSIGEIKHFDLWNRNVEFIEQEALWERPAVFIEICPITWEPKVGANAMRGSGLVKLHIVTDWKGSAADGSLCQEEALSVFDYSRKIQECIDGLTGEEFHSLHLAETHTNHDHEEIVESIEVYKLRCVRTM